MPSIFLIYISLLGFIYYTIYYANHTDLLIQRHEREEVSGEPIYYGGLDRRIAMMRSLLFVGVAFIGLFVFYWMMIAFAVANPAPEVADSIPDINPVMIMLGLILCITTTFLANRTVASATFRMRIHTYIPTYNPNSWVHNTAIIFMLLLLTAQIILFLSQGGTEAMAQSIEAQGVSATELLFQLWLQVIAAFLGVGLFIRRNLPNTLVRLGLRMPTRQDWSWGIGGGLALLGVLWVFGMIVSIVIMLIAPDQLDNVQAMNRANDSIASAVATIPLALLLSTSAAIGEEILFRGALQPIFGNLLISIFFATLHTQSLLSPAILLLLMVSYGLGIIRQKASTTAAIIAHFLYNFLQLLLAILLVSTMGGM